jgi:hypothetical protein
MTSRAVPGSDESRRARNAQKVRELGVGGQRPAAARLGSGAKVTTAVGVRVTIVDEEAE